MYPSTLVLPGDGDGGGSKQPPLSLSQLGHGHQTDPGAFSYYRYDVPEGELARATLVNQAIGGGGGNSGGATSATGATLAGSANREGGAFERLSRVP
jgi:hypothetical protein